MFLFLFCVSLIIDNKLQYKFKTCNTDWMVIKEKKQQNIFLPQLKRDSSTILILKFTTQGLYGEHKLDSSIM